MVGAGALVLVARYARGEVFAAGGDAVAPGGVGDVGLKGPLSPSVDLAIDPDGTVYAIAHRSEMGSGSKTALPRILADELDADWARVKIVQATGDEKYGDQDTDGSHSVTSFFTTLRQAGGSARLMLVRAAAQQWKVSENECSTEPHMVVHKATGRKLGYGEVAAAAGKLAVRKNEGLQLKTPQQWRYIGKGTSNYDLKDMCTGKAVYGQDTHMEGMLFASVAHPPVLGGTVKSLR